MNFNKYVKLILCLFATAVITSCGSNTGDVNNEISGAEESQNEANARRNEDTEAERQARARSEPLGGLEKRPARP